jgi:hypothetical protein
MFTYREPANQAQVAAGQAEIDDEIRKNLSEDALTDSLPAKEVLRFKYDVGKEASVRLCVLCVSVVNLIRKILTTETQKTLRTHRERQAMYFPGSLAGC